MYNHRNTYFIASVHAVHFQSAVMGEKFLVHATKCKGYSHRRGDGMNDRATMLRDITMQLQKKKEEQKDGDGLLWWKAMLFS